MVWFTTAIFSTEYFAFRVPLGRGSAPARRCRSGKFQYVSRGAVANGAPVHEDLVEAIRARRLHGVLFVGEQNPEAALWLQKQEVPMAALAYTDLAPWRVKIDHAETVRLGVKTLAAQGCRRIALLIPLGSGLGRAEGEKSFAELDAFKSALKKSGIAYDSALVWRENELDAAIPAHPLESNQEQGFRALNELCEEDATRPDGIIFLDDMMARGALVALARLGIRPGHDIKIATHLNKGSTALHGYEDELALIEVDPTEIVGALFTMLETLMSGETPPDPVVSIRAKLRR